MKIPAIALPLVLGLTLLGPAARAQPAAPDTAAPTPIDALSLPGVVQLDPRVPVEAAYRMQHRLIWQGARKHAAKVREEREARGLKVKKDARGRRPGTRAEMPQVSPLTPAPPVATGVPAPFTTSAAPPNVRANDPTGDSPVANQGEISLATIGTSALLSWNDGQGFEGSGGPVQGVASSASNGQSWIDQGDPPVPASGWAVFRWRGDPVVTANAKNGGVFLFGLADVDRDGPFADSSAIVMARAHFNRGALVWDDVRVVRAQPRNDFFLDKEWAVADSSTGNLYVVYTEFDLVAETNRIRFTRSTNSGVSWSSPLTLSSAADEGDVQGARVAVGPGGEVHTVWFHNDPASAFYQLRFRRSLTDGVSFESQQTPLSHVANSGTGAPGFNRANGVDMPTLAVDRTTGQYRGRVYLGFSESYNYGDDAWAAQPPASTVIFESEPNNNAAGADVFTLGQTLRGSITTSDQDWYRCTLAAGQNVIVWLDSIPTAVVNVSVLAPGGVERLALGQGGTFSNGFFPVLYTFTSGSAGTYYFRVQGLGNGGSGGYRLRTKAGVSGSERGRDRRDVFVAWSQNGTGGFSTPVRVCDSSIGSDDFLPEVTVGPDGHPYLIWYDERLDPLLALTHVFLSRSSNGGGAWLANERISDFSGSFTTCGANSFPNMGDYLGIAANATHLIAGWADARGTDVDVYTEGFPVALALASCPPDTTAAAGTTFTRWLNFQNPNPFYPDQYLYSISDDRGWVNAVNNFFSLQPQAYQPLPTTLQIPASAANGTVDHVCVSVANSTQASAITCCYDVTVTSLVAADAGPAPEFTLSQSVPNPAVRTASIAYSLPATGRVHLAIYDLAGARVRTLVDAVAGAGPHTVQWDARDDEGHAVGAGVYFYRLAFGAQRAEHRLVLLR